jgi:hypothetical protein
MDRYKFLLVFDLNAEKVGRGIEVVFTGGFEVFGVFLDGKSW